MKKNIGLIDRILRFTAAILFVYLYAANIIQGTLGIILIILTVMFLLTGILSWCPLYMPFKISTTKKSNI